MPSTTPISPQVMPFSRDERNLFTECSRVSSTRDSAASKQKPSSWKEQAHQPHHDPRALVPPERRAGFDTGTLIDFDKSTAEEVNVSITQFHHADDGGYTGWTSATVTVRSSLVFGFRITVSGRNKNDIKDYIHECKNELEPQFRRAEAPMTAEERSAVSHLLLSTGKPFLEGGPYMFGSYTSWAACARLLIRRGFSVEQAEWILRHKTMRWASDLRVRGFKASSGDLRRFLDKHGITPRYIELTMKEENR